MELRTGLATLLELTLESANCMIDSDPALSAKQHIITLIGLIRLEFGRALRLILPLTMDSVFSFVCRTIQSNPIQSDPK
jgi:hypothetical protein